MMMKPLIDSALLPYCEAVAHSSAPLPSVFPAMPAEPQSADMLAFLQQLVRMIHQVEGKQNREQNCESNREENCEQNREPIESFVTESDLEAFVCWALDQSYSSYFSQDESLLLLELAWRVQKHLWAAHSSWLL